MECLTIFVIFTVAGVKYEPLLGSHSAPEVLGRRAASVEGHKEEPEEGLDDC